MSYQQRRYLAQMMGMYGEMSDNDQQAPEEATSASLTELTFAYTVHVMFELGN